jgi:hypothetical protein
MYPRALKEKGHPKPAARYNPFQNSPKVEVKWEPKPKIS